LAGNEKILVADDDSLMREFILETLGRLGYDAIGVVDGNQAREVLKKERYNLVITDIKMPGANGIDVLKTAMSVNAECKVILITGYGTIENAVEAMKEGAFDYLTKSEKTSPDEIELVVKKALNYQKLETENRLLRSELSGRYAFSNMIGKSPQMQRIYDMVNTVANSNATVLITGKSGTGKELVARAIHFNGGRKDGPFVKLNCAAVPDGLVESELFGHEKGAFTGAIKTVKGRFEMADSGTLLLDEISEMSVSLQAKLLRVLQEQQFERVGSGHTIETDVRIIATSNRNLGSEVRKGKFREDLYYRLNVIPIELPDLSQRREDIPLLAIHFMEKYAKLNDKNITSISESSMKILSEYNWHGNVRELENFIERAIVVSRTGTLNEADFPSQLFAVEENEIGEGIQAKASIHEMEKSLILKTLQANNGNRTRAAKSLGITTRTLRNKLHEYGLGSNH